jgi:hypothetical protein
MLIVNVKSPPSVTPALTAAVADPGTDDRPAIQGIIDYVGKNGGGIVYFPPGTYKIVGAIYVDLSAAPNSVELRGVELRGAGMNQSILQYGDVNNTQHLLTVTAAYCRLRRLGLDGRGDWLHLHTTAPSGTDGAHCLNVVRLGTDTALEAPKYFEAIECRFTNAYNKQVVVNGIRNVTFRRCEFDGGDNTAGNNDGLHFYGGTYPCTDIKVSRCRFFRQLRSGVFCDVDVRRVRIEDCEFRNAGYGETTDPTSGCLISTEPQAPKSSSAVAVWMEGYGDDLVVLRCTTSRYYAGVALRAGVKRVRIEQNRFLAASNAGVQIGAERPLYDLVDVEARFDCVKESEDGNAVVARDVLVKDNIIQFQSHASSPVELVEQNGASGAVVIVGFGPPAPTPPKPDILGYVGRVIVDNFVVLPSSQPTLSARQLVLVAMRSGERFVRLIVRNCETTSGVKQLIRYINIGTGGGNGQTPDHLVVEGNRLAGLSETSTFAAGAVVEVRNNVITKFRMLDSGTARVFDASATAAIVRDNVIGTAGGHVATPAYQVTATNVLDTNLMSAV